MAANITQAQRRAACPRIRRGAKWLREADYLTDADRDLIMDEVAKCAEMMRRMGEAHLIATIGVRAPAYTGEPHPIAAITYGPGGGSLYGFAYRP